MMSGALQLNCKSQISEESSSKEYCTWQQVEVLVEKLAHTIQSSGKEYDVILAITNGGIIPAKLIARELNVNHIQFIPIRNKKLYIEEIHPLHKGRKYLIIDDIYDTGDTFNKVYVVVKEFDCDFAFLMTRYKNSNAPLVAKVLNHEKWIVFPWERKRY
jgi:hypoxanthine phosphoribosyltransferase